MTQSNEAPDTKIEFRTESEGEVYVETLWATKLSDKKYKLDNSPFYAYGVSWEDTIEAEKETSEGFPVFKRVLTKSGNKTVRIIFNPPVSEGNSGDLLLKELLKMGCSFEGANPKYIAVNIPPNLDIMTIRKKLIEAKAEWEHADPTYTELFPE